MPQAMKWPFEAKSKRAPLGDEERTPYFCDGLFCCVDYRTLQAPT
jgi:hypothetical protein